MGYGVFLGFFQFSSFLGWVLFGKDFICVLIFDIGNFGELDRIVGFLLGARIFDSKQVIVMDLREVIIMDTREDEKVGGL